MQVRDRYRKEVIQVSTRKNDVKVQFLYDRIKKKLIDTIKFDFDYFQFQSQKNYFPFINIYQEFCKE